MTSLLSAASPPILDVTETHALSASVIIAISVVGFLFVGVVLLAIMSLRKTRLRFLLSQSTLETPSSSHSVIGKLVLFNLNSLPDPVDEWEKGAKTLTHKDSLIGNGSMGESCKASFQKDKFVIVKKLETFGNISNQREFEDEMGRLCKLKHPNLVPIQGYYWSSSKQLIVSDYIPNGSLHHHLHKKRSGVPLSWFQRYHIALGIARALAYLHHECKPRVLHGNVKAANIVLTEDFYPFLSDYGVLKLLPTMNNSHQPFHTTFGYRAPELERHPTRLNEKCDVYAFGVVLMEIVTGQQAVKQIGKNVVKLSHYVRARMDQGRVRKCINSQLPFQDHESAILYVLIVALLCTKELPSTRPTMAQVVDLLELVNKQKELHT